MRKSAADTEEATTRHTIKEQIKEQVNDEVSSLRKPIKEQVKEEIDEDMEEVRKPIKEQIADEIDEDMEEVRGIRDASKENKAARQEYKAARQEYKAEEKNNMEMGIDEAPDSTTLDEAKNRKKEAGMELVSRLFHDDNNDSQEQAARNSANEQVSEQANEQAADEPQEDTSDIAQPTQQTQQAQPTQQEEASTREGEQQANALPITTEQQAQQVHQSSAMLSPNATNSKSSISQKNNTTSTFIEEGYELSQQGKEQVRMAKDEVDIANRMATRGQQKYGIDENIQENKKEYRKEDIYKSLDPNYIPNKKYKRQKMWGQILAGIGDTAKLIGGAVTAKNSGHIIPFKTLSSGVMQDNKLSDREREQVLRGIELLRKGKLAEAAALPEKAQSKLDKILSDKLNYIKKNSSKRELTSLEQSMAENEQAQKASKSGGSSKSEFAKSMELKGNMVLQISKNGVLGNVSVNHTNLYTHRDNILDFLKNNGKDISDKLAAAYYTVKDVDKLVESGGQSSVSKDFNIFYSTAFAELKKMADKGNRKAKNLLEYTENEIYRARDAWRPFPEEEPNKDSKKIMTDMDIFK